MRDPVTGQIKKVYIGDRKKDELKLNQEMKKVHSFVGHNSRVSVRSDLAPSSDILSQFYQQEHVQIFDDNSAYKNFIK